MLGWNIIHFLRDGTLDNCYIRIICQQDLPSPLLNINSNYLSTRYKSTWL